jgi:hypothetical protein
MLNGILASFQLISMAMTLRPQLKVLNGQLRAQFKAGRISFLDAQLQKKLITGQAICFTTLCDQTALQRAWQGHFANIEAGHGVDLVELLQLCGLEDLLQTTPGPDDFLCLPTLEEIEAPCVEHTHLERLALTTYSPSAKFFAGFLYPLFAKSSSYHSEPIQFKGGILCEAYKG